MNGFVKTRIYGKIICIFTLPENPLPCSWKGWRVWNTGFGKAQIYIDINTSIWYAWIDEKYAYVEITI